MLMLIVNAGIISKTWLELGAAIVKKGGAIIQEEKRQDMFCFVLVPW